MQSCPYTDFILKVKSYLDDYRNSFLRSRTYSTITCYSPPPISLSPPEKNPLSYYKAILTFPIQVKIVFFPMPPNSSFNNSQSQYQNHINNSNHNYKKKNLQQMLTCKLRGRDIYHPRNSPCYHRFASPLPSQTLCLKYARRFSFLS